MADRDRLSQQEYIDIDHELALAEKEMHDADEQLRILHARFKEEKEKRKPRRGQFPRAS